VGEGRGGGFERVEERKKPPYSHTEGVGVWGCGSVGVWEGEERRCHMARVPERPDEIFGEFIEDYRNVYGEDLVSIVLYGSGARGEYVKGVSDLNFLIVLVEASIGQLTRAIPLITRWKKRNVASPLFLTEQYIASSLDTFPIEFLDMQTAYQVVFGEDVLAGLSFDHVHLRLQCERELRGKLLHLRQAYLDIAGQERELRILVRRSVTTFASIFRGLLTLQKIPVPTERQKILLKTAEVFGFDSEVFRRLGAWCAGEAKLKTEEERVALFGQYVEQIDQLIDAVDRWER
jgi:hypothetical protein